MRKFVLAMLTMLLTLGLTIAAQVTFVSFDAEKKELKVKDGDDEKTYKVTDKTTFKTGDKDTPAEKGLTRLGKMKAKAKFDVTVEKDTVTEVKFPAPKAKAER
jgi:hypothetical protein